MNTNAGEGVGKSKTNGECAGMVGVVLRVGQDVLSITAGRRHPGDKEAWWWNAKVQEVIQANKEARKLIENIRKARGHR